MNQPPDNPPATSEQRTRLGALRHALLGLHKALLEAERVRYERWHGRIEDGFPLLNKVMHDPEFAWLRPVSALIVQIDEGLENDEMSEVDALSIQIQLRVMVMPSETGDEFGRNYHRAMQESPDVVMAHKEIAPLLVERRASP